MKFQTFGEMSENPMPHSCSQTLPQDAGRIAELEKNLHALKEKYSELEQQNQAVDHQTLTSDMSEEIKNFRSTMNRQSKISQMLSAEKENLERKTTDHMLVNRRLEDQMSDLKVGNQFLNDRLDMSISQNKEMIMENEHLKSQVQVSVTRVLNLEEELRRIKSELAVEESNYVRQKAVLADTQANFKRLTESNVVSQIQKSEIETHNRMTTVELSLLKEKQQDLSQKLRNAEENLLSLNIKANQETLEQEAYIQTFNESRETQNLLLENETLLHGEKKNLLGAIKERCEEEGRLVGDIEELQGKIRLLEGDNDRLIEQLSKMNNFKA